MLDRWRKEGIKVPVLVLTARDSWSDKVAGLDAGADDYLAKPFQTEELNARLRALIRRASGNASSELTAGRHGERIADYPDDTPYPSVLLLGFIDTRPLHVVVAVDRTQGVCYVVTAYEPDLTLWEPDFKTRRLA